MEPKSKILIAVGLWIAFIALLTKPGQQVASETGGYIMEQISGAINLIKGFEGFSPTAYKDARGYSIGYGHFILPGENLSRITEDQATQLLIQDTSKAQDAVTNYVTVPLTQNQNDALVSLTYNIGVNAFKNSTLLRMLNAGDYQAATDQFSVWRLSQGTVIQALVDRRAAERDLFLA